MKRIIGTVFAAFIALVLFFVMLPVLIQPSLVMGKKAQDLPALGVLELDLTRGLTDQPRAALFGVTGDTPLSVIGVVEALARAETDERIAGLFMRVGGSSELPVAQAQELRDALISFRANGKYVIAHSRGFYAVGLGAYYAASESDELWMRPDGPFAASDIRLEALSAGSSSVSPVNGVAGDASSVIGARQPTRTGPGTLEALRQSIFERTTKDIAVSRDMAAQDVATLLGAGPRAAAQAFDAGLVTRLGYEEDAKMNSLSHAGEGAQTIAWDAYLKAAGRPFGEGAVIAVVYAEGAINSENDDTATTSVISANQTAHAIRSAAADEDVKAILFRIDSSGGSASASDQIWEAVTFAREHGKPVVVSMGSVAASGGYYVATAADRIIAQPTTITGSIGVAGGKYVLGDTWGSLGLTISENIAGGFAPDMGVSGEEGGQGQWQSVNTAIGNVYSEFTSKVAEGRGLSLDAVYRVANGRVWSGAQARELGLIDDLGGYRHAIGETKRMIGLEDNAAVELRNFPGPGNTWQRITEMLGVSSAAGEVVMMFSQMGQVETLKDLTESVYNGVQTPDQLDHTDQAEEPSRQE